MENEAQYLARRAAERERLKAELADLKILVDGEAMSVDELRRRIGGIIDRYLGGSTNELESSIDEMLSAYSQLLTAQERLAFLEDLGRQFGGD